MAVYYFVLALLPLALVASSMRSRDVGRLLLFGAAAAAIVISGLRWESDVDHPEYAEMFAVTPDLANFNRDSIWDLHGEPGYLLASSILKSLGLSFFVLSAACAAFAVGAKAWVASQLSRSASLAFCLYLCIHFITIEFIQIRWAVASALIALAVYHQFHRRLFVVVVLLALAVGFHYFSAIFVLVCLLAEVRKESFFYFVIVSVSLFGLVLAMASPVIPLVFDSDIYIIKRTLRYLTDPISDVGLLSYAKLAMIPLAYFVLAKRYPYVSADLVTNFMRRIAFASIAATLLVSFVPLMHFRAVVLADFFALLLLVRILDQRANQFERIAILSVFSVLYAIWYVIDIANYVAADRLYEYRTWLPPLI